jgi:hypothetical protein
MMSTLGTHLIEEDVSQLEVPVYDAPCVHVPDRGHELQEVVPHLTLLQPRSTLQQLHHGLTHQKTRE